jgi:hypothetical protein
MDELDAEASGEPVGELGEGPVTSNEESVTSTPRGNSASDVQR